jgi:hypothetical protein
VPHEFRNKVLKQPMDCWMIGLAPKPHGLTMLKNFAKKPYQEHRKNIKNEDTME